jgi:hypothetical protein
VSAPEEPRVSKFRISIDFDGVVDLDVSEVWPDGDAPARPTAAAVVAEIERTGSLHSFLRDWNIGGGFISVHVDVTEIAEGHGVIGRDHAKANLR